MNVKISLSLLCVLFSSLAVDRRRPQFPNVTKWASFFNVSETNPGANPWWRWSRRVSGETIEGYYGCVLLLPCWVHIPLLQRPSRIGCSACDVDAAVINHSSHIFLFFSNFFFAPGAGVCLWKNRILVHVGHRRRRVVIRVCPRVLLLFTYCKTLRLFVFCFVLS